MGYRCEELGKAPKGGGTNTVFCQIKKNVYLTMKVSEFLRSIYYCKLVDLGGTLEVHLPRSNFFHWPSNINIKE